MQIKVMIIGVIIACSYLIGEYIYKAYTSRHKQVKELIRILEIIRMDLSFGLYTLEEIFRRISSNSEFSTTKFFTIMADELQHNNLKSLNNILDDSLGVLKKETYLRNKEVDELKELILTLGKSDVESQERMIDLSISNLKRVTEDTKDDIDKKGSVYKKLATIIGVILGIILI